MGDQIKIKLNANVICAEAMAAYQPVTEANLVECRAMLIKECGCNPDPVSNSRFQLICEWSEEDTLQLAKSWIRQKQKWQVAPGKQISEPPIYKPTFADLKKVLGEIDAASDESQLIYGVLNYLTPQLVQSIKDLPDLNDLQGALAGKGELKDQLTNAQFSPQTKQQLLDVNSLLEKRKGEIEAALAKVKALEEAAKLPVAPTPAPNAATTEPPKVGLTDPFAEMFKDPPKVAPPAMPAPKSAADEPPPSKPAAPVAAPQPPPKAAPAAPAPVVGKPPAPVATPVLTAQVAGAMDGAAHWYAGLGYWSDVLTPGGLEFEQTLQVQNPYDGYQNPYIASHVLMLHGGRQFVQSKIFSYRLGGQLEWTDYAAVNDARPFTADFSTLTFGVGGSAIFNWTRLGPAGLRSSLGLALSLGTLWTDVDEGIDVGVADGVYNTKDSQLLTDVKVTIGLIGVEWHGLEWMFALDIHKNGYSDQARGTPKASDVELGGIFIAPEVVLGMEW